jgi:hypothetical protein
MARWLAPQLPGPQLWVLHDRDAALLRLAATQGRVTAADGSAVDLETRNDDVTRLGDLGRADVVTASALLDMLTNAELDRIVASCAAAGCPVLLTLSVVGRTALSPADPLDERVTDAFNAHQRRSNGSGRLLGPDAVAAARDGFRRRGLEVLVRDSPWRLGRHDAALVEEWFVGWLGAACEQEPDLGAVARDYASRRLAQVRAGELAVVVHHEDLLALPR